jgi:hypothetical protein
VRYVKEKITLPVKIKKILPTSFSLKNFALGVESIPFIRKPMSSELLRWSSQ